MKDFTNSNISNILKRFPPAFKVSKQRHKNVLAIRPLLNAKIYPFIKKTRNQLLPNFAHKGTRTHARENSACVATYVAAAREMWSDLLTQ